MIDDIEQKPRYVIRNAADALEPQPPIEEVVNGLISKGSVSIFYGEPGSKKTYALIDLGVCVGGSKQWLKFDITNTKVLFIDEESGPKRFHKRLGEVLRGEECGPETPFEYICYGAFKLDNLNDIVLLQAIIEESHAGLVIIDALADCMTGDENSKQDTQPVFTNLKKIADQTNAAIILIHHAGKGGNYRGSSAIKGGVDNMVLVESENGKNVVSFTCEKSRDGESQEWAAIATWFEDKFFLRSSLSEIEPHFAKSEKYVMRYIDDHGESPIPEIMGAADVCTDQAARQAVYSLTGKGIIYRTNPNEKGKGAVAKYARKIQNDNY